MQIFIFTFPCGTSERFYEDPKGLHKTFFEVPQRSEKTKIYINPYCHSSLRYLKDLSKRHIKEYRCLKNVILKYTVKINGYSF